MIDFHSHILPGMDDGSRNTEMSLEMLRLEQQAGVDTIVLTPHFYADQNSPRRFLARRARSWDALQEKLEPGMPKLLLGAEVQYFEGIANVDDLPSLCIEGTNVLLLEMPFCRWNEHIITSVLELNSFGDIQIVLAHIERYLADQPKDIWEEFVNCGVMAQVNTSFFRGWFKRRKALSMMNRGLFQLIGSDCHNLDTRRPDWEPVPDAAKEYAARNANKLLFGK